MRGCAWRSAAPPSSAAASVSSGVALTSFQLVLGETLWYELRDTGVDVLVMVGGLMNTQGDAFAKFPRWFVV